MSMLSMHPGEYIKMVYLDGFGMRVTDLAANLRVSNSTVSRLVSRKSDLSPNMALRLSYVLGQSAEFWMSMQCRHSLAEEMTKFSFDGIGPKKADQPPIKKWNPGESMIAELLSDGFSSEEIDELISVVQLQLKEGIARNVDDAKFLQFIRRPGNDILPRHTPFKMLSYWMPSREAQEIQEERGFEQDQIDAFILEFRTEKQRTNLKHTRKDWNTKFLKWVVQRKG